MQSFQVEELQERKTKAVPFSKTFSAYANTTSTVLGAGTLAVPIAMSSAGLASYVMITVFVILVNTTTVTWLVRVSQELPEHVPRSYEGIAREYLGHRAAHVISVVFIFGGLSLGMSRMLFTALSLAPIVAGILYETPSPAHLKSMELPLLWLCGLLVVLPLGLLRDISKLQFTSSLAIATLSFAAAFIVFCNISALKRAPEVGEGFQWVNWDTAVFLSLAMTTSNFSCHISAIPIYESLGTSSPETMRRVVFAAMATGALVYQLVGLSSYLRFGHLESADGSNILEVVAERICEGHSPILFGLASMASGGMATALVLGMPVVLWALRSVLLSYLKAGEATNLEWSLATTAIICSILSLATLVPDIQVVMSVGGSLGGTFIAFMYPSLFHLAVVRQVRSVRQLRWQHWPEVAVILMSLVYGALCFSISLGKVFSSQEPDIPSTTPTYSDYHGYEGPGDDAYDYHSVTS